VRVGSPDAPRAAAGLSRRDFLTGTFRPRAVGLAATGGPVWTQAVSQSAAPELALRPPGALEKREFLASCIKCGECVEACPFDTLQLAKADDGIGIGTPWFAARKTPCYMCEDTPCIRECPTGSLARGTAIEDARMGLAVLADQETCLAFRGLRCEVCYRVCPLMGRAISLEFRSQARTGKHAFFLPVVNSDHCTGCGMCEHACVLDEAAIKVLPRELAKGAVQQGYRFGWTEPAAISEDFGGADDPEGPWQGDPRRVLEEINDLSGIEEP
jgi:ferredoxin-type protein NapG